MSLKDTVYTLQDIRNLGPPADPGLYVAADYTGTLEDIVNLPIVSMAAKIWCVTKFLDEKHSRQLCLNSIREAGVQAGLDSFTTLWAFLGRWQACLDEDAPYFHIHDDILMEMAPAFSAWTADQACQKKEKYSRLIAGLKWATYKEADEEMHGNDYKLWCYQALQDVAIAGGWGIVKDKFLAILEIHP